MIHQMRLSVVLVALGTFPEKVNLCALCLARVHLFCGIEMSFVVVSRWPKSAFWYRDLFWGYRDSAFCCSASRSTSSSDQPVRVFWPQHPVRWRSQRISIPKRRSKNLKTQKQDVSISTRISGISKPIVCQTYGLHVGRLSRNGNRENDENAEDNSDSYKQGVECWIRGNHRNHRNDENHGNPGCKPGVPQP